MVASKAQKLTLEWTTRILASNLAHKHSTKLERFAKDKNYNLLQTFVDYDLKKFYTTCTLGP
jgi:hypothetical protein